MILSIVFGDKNRSGMSEDIRSLRAKSIYSSLNLSTTAPRCTYSSYDSTTIYTGKSGLSHEPFTEGE